MFTKKGCHFFPGYGSSEPRPRRSQRQSRQTDEDKSEVASKKEQTSESRIVAFRLQSVSKDVKYTGMYFYTFSHVKKGTI